ncbi:chromatin remodeling protein EBS-like isoform X1 [Cucumis melo var. makuwa]|uniref:Chromatin remodeling protein EBS-like isoform X1 n=1 Tax=Cucumis melo var. makuwa TaxID=1194695 RepID=A0A5D3C9X7_CUCMM|nr:chromatin remodeling protein EBS-like isoform X1 [Cucumis melo var. makuwa]TYK07129.1 chromatin remodeling protein EBS-like isoform X1 [Cucumis melo var. makuwa]
MAKTKPGKKDLDSYTIKGTNKIVRPGDCVLMRPSDSDKPPYVARVEKIEADHRNNVKVRVRWYYRPEESIGGRRQFHGAKELFLSDHFDVQSAHTIEGKCTVHSFKNYTKLENVGAEDYFCRFEYKAATGGFTPDRVAVYCKCEMPYNPDDLMVQCEGCKDWFHPSCMGMTIEEAKKLDHFLCSDCSSENEAKRSLNAFPVSPSAEAKVFQDHLSSQIIVRIKYQKKRSEWILLNETDIRILVLNSHARWSQSAGRDDGLIRIHGSDKEVRFPGPFVSVNVDVEMYSEDKILCSHKPEVDFVLWMQWLDIEAEEYGGNCSHYIAIEMKFLTNFESKQGG